MQNEEKYEEAQLYLEEDLDKAIKHQKYEYQNIRAGRANPHILDRITVDYYGVPTPILQMANINVPEARMITITCWDQSQVKNVSKAISLADLGIAPSDDGKVIRLIFPILTEERRKDLVKQVKKICEETKIAMRNARRDAMDVLKQMKKDAELSEDEFASCEKDLQKVVDAKISEADALSIAKEKEIMEI